MKRLVFYSAVLLSGLGGLINASQASEVTPAFLSGGIGDDDKILAEKKVAETLSPGPLFYARLPPGSYHITAVYSGKTLSKSVALKANESRDVHFYWD